MKSGDWQRRFHEWHHSGNLSKLLPEITALGGVPQPVEFHAEGDVLTHTLLAVDAVKPGADERVFWAVLLHDIGKALTTKFVNDRWRSHGHANIGATMVPDILGRLDLDSIADDVTWLVKHHHFALDWGNHVFTRLTPRQKRFCALPLFPFLVEVCQADAAASLGSSSKGERLNLILGQLVDDSGAKND